MRMFFFGTLVDPDLRAIVLGRDPHALDVERASVFGMRRSRALGEWYPILVPDPAGRVDGLLAGGLTARDIDRLRFYEGIEYDLQPIQVFAGDRHHTAHAFTATDRLAESGDAWDLSAWQRTDKALSLVVADELMRLYGRLSMSEMEDHWATVTAQAHWRYEQERGWQEHAPGPAPFDWLAWGTAPLPEFIH